MSGVYEGLTVVELADRRNQWAGKLLADGGARVIQVEPIDGSPGRWCGPFVDDKADPDRCLDYWWYNTGKQSVALDLARKPAQDLVRKLILRADVFLESTPPGTLAARGLDYVAVSHHRALIYASLTDCVFTMSRDVTVDEINRLLRDAADGELKDILGFEDRPLVSADYTNDPRSGIVDGPSTMVVDGRMVKVLVWYDNEYGYVHRMAELVAKVGASIGTLR